MSGFNQSKLGQAEAKVTQYRPTQGPCSAYSSS